MVFHALGIEPDDLLILLDGQLQDFLRLGPSLHVTQRAQLNAAQQAVRLEIVAIAFEDVLRFQDRVLDAAAARIQLGESGVQVVRSRIVLDGEPVFIDCLVGVIGAAIHRDHFLEDMGHREVVIRGSLIGRLLPTLGYRRRSRSAVARGWRGLVFVLVVREVLGEAANRAGQQECQEKTTSASWIHSDRTSHYYDWMFYPWGNLLILAAFGVGCEK